MYFSVFWNYGLIRFTTCYIFQEVFSVNFITPKLLITLYFKQIKFWLSKFTQRQLISETLIYCKYSLLEWQYWTSYKFNLHYVFRLRLGTVRPLNVHVTNRFYIKNKRNNCYFHFIINDTLSHKDNKKTNRRGVGGAPNVTTIAFLLETWTPSLTQHEGKTTWYCC